MASLIMIVPKPNTHMKKSFEFFDVVDKYMLSQGWTITDDLPKTYFMQKHIAPTRVSDFTKVIKSTNNYRDVVLNIYVAASLQKL